MPSSMRLGLSSRRVELALSSVHRRPPRTWGRYDRWPDQERKVGQTEIIRKVGFREVGRIRNEKSAWNDVFSQQPRSGRMEDGVGVSQDYL